MLGLIDGRPPKKAVPLKVTDRFASVLLLLAVLTAAPVSTLARAPAPRESDGTAGMAVVSVGRLPEQGRVVYQLIRRGGPFQYDKDGSVFGNRERLLPLERRGYYREYTVDTPGAPDRGARRIVCGGPKRSPVACYYTSDHYASFRRLVEED